MTPPRPGDPVTVVLNLTEPVWLPGRLKRSKIVLRRTWWSTVERIFPRGRRPWPWGTSRLPLELEGIVWIRGHHRNTSPRAKALLTAYWLHERELHAHRR